MEIGREPRLGDVAERAGVSVATVSRVLNNRGYLSRETRDRVARAIDELAYRPNQLARSLVRQRTGTIGLIVPTVAMPFFGEVAAQIENQLADNGLRLLLCNSFGRADREREHLELLVRHRVHGIISGAHNDDLPDYRTIRQPVVTIDRELAPHIPNVRADNLAAGRMATEHLLRRGSRRPALLTSRSRARNLREQGYRAVLGEAGIEPLVFTADFHMPEPQRTQTVRAALDSCADTVDGVFATDDLLAATALEWAFLAGKSVPQDLRIVGFDGTTTLRLALPGLTTIRQPIAEIAATAVDLLLRAIDTDLSKVAGPDGLTIELPVTLIEGRTT